MKRLVPSLLRENATLVKPSKYTQRSDIAIHVYCHQNVFLIFWIRLSDSINSAGLFFCDLIPRGRFIKGHGMEGSQIRTSQLVRAVSSGRHYHSWDYGKNRVTFFKSIVTSHPTLRLSYACLSMIGFVNKCNNHDSKALSFSFSSSYLVSN